MENEKRLTYFFDDMGQVVEVTDELFDRYSDSIAQIRFLQAQVEEALFEKMNEENAMQKFARVMKGEEDIGCGPVKSTKQILALYLNDDAPVEEIDTYLWTSGGFVNDYDDDWYLANARENLNFVFDKTKVSKMLRQFIMNRISKAG